MQESKVLIEAGEFSRLFIENRPFLDVRSEIESARGTFPGAVNLPILTTIEREQVGTCYKQRGSAAAIEFGHRLVNLAVREARIDAWAAFVHDNPDACVYCWRGGMRSGLAQQWLAERSIVVPRVAGGYKALRGFLLEYLEQVAPGIAMIRVGGRTGCGKTTLVRESSRGIDLEAAANHRGSSFGGHARPPATQANFEHSVAIGLLRLRHRYSDGPVFVEDEGRRIGPVSLPETFHQAMQSAPLVLVELPFERRVDNILRDYVLELCAEFMALDPAEGFKQFAAHLGDSLGRIRRRLGDQHYREARQLLDRALEAQQRHGISDLHRAWIALLLNRYYDGMYDFQLRQCRAPVLFRGNDQDVREWLKAQA